MKVLVFDVETTGLMTERNASITDTTKWPYIVQLSYLIYDTAFNKITMINDDIIRLPNDINMSDICSNIHGITKEKSNLLGININYALIKFNECLKKADCIVAHNISFDKRIIMVECIRNNIKQQFNINGIKKNEYCTMKNGINICKIKIENLAEKTYYKFPKLSELYYHYFKTIPNGLHNSKKDILVCLRCYCKMIYNYDICDFMGLDEFDNSKNILDNLFNIQDETLQIKILNDYESSPKRQRIE